MFTGIIQGIGTVSLLEKKNSIYTYSILSPKNILLDLSIGDSVSNNGCCLTVSKIKKNEITFDLIQETIKLTSFKKTKIGDDINLEKSISLSQGLSGHLMSGHIACTGTILTNDINEYNRKMYINIDNKSKIKYIFYKGYIGIDGISLTVSGIKNFCFCVDLIPETLKRTNLKNKKIGDLVNIEIDSNTQAIVNTVEKQLKKYRKLM
ncbi:ribE [Wigglesworthia glossinidia endosymbiont of Glossina brevipalpis]|uniref:Riboflavin synthase n=1 Tax=Wigglesworthia glossinidia brevipalpis TaxID=36870 RepID=Q8D2M1_WIGBR|nr:ribE [Wigglesworthia glossinidia endosymbiont of Glossina brevipalpis]